jgi:hypothetical protein
MNGYLWDPLAVKLVNRFFKLETLETDSKMFQELFRVVSANPKNRAPGNFIKVQSGSSMNNIFYGYYHEEDIPASVSRMFFSFARLRFALLRKLGWRGLIQLRQQRALSKDVLRGLALVPFHGTKLRESRLVRTAFRSHKI